MRVQWPEGTAYCRMWFFWVFTSETLVVCRLLWNLLFLFCFGWGGLFLRRVRGGGGWGSGEEGVE